MLLCTTGDQLQWTLRALTQAGVTVPEDLSVLAVEDTVAAPTV